MRLVNLIMALGLVLSSTLSIASDDTPDIIRQGFVKAAQNLDYRTAYLSQLEAGSIDVSESFRKAYLGTAKAMAAEVNVTPWSKLSYFNEGTELIEEAIQSNPTNPEFRFLRLMIQLNSPAFLNYQDNIKSDYKSVVYAVEHADKQEIWMQYFLEFSEQNKKKLTPHISKS